MTGVNIQSLNLDVRKCRFPDADFVNTARDKRGSAAGAVLAENESVRRVHTPYPRYVHGPGFDSVLKQRESASAPEYGGEVMPVVIGDNGPRYVFFVSSIRYIDLPFALVN